MSDTYSIIILNTISYTIHEAYAVIYSLGDNNFDMKSIGIVATSITNFKKDLNEFIIFSSRWAYDV